MRSKALIYGLVATAIVTGLILIVVLIAQGRTTIDPSPANVLSSSTNECVECHERNTPGIIAQFGRSSMAAADVLCEDCHLVDPEYPGAVEHEGDYILAAPTTAKCETCHESEVAQFNASRHGIPAYVAYAGAEGLSEVHLAVYEAIPEGSFQSDRARNDIYALEGKVVTRFTCEVCHDIGKPAEDQSIGRCQKCHLRHQFSLDQSRRPETCNACHIGPDHPQYEIYFESPHGISYATNGQHWNWEAETGTLTTADFPAPTCAICHMSGFGGTGTTHDVGDRLSWYLFADVSQRRPAWQDNQVRMQTVCSECHNATYIDGFYEDADALVLAVNDWVLESQEIIKPLKSKNLLTDAPFDEPIDFVFFDLWHHWGRTTKFGAWMQGPDYSQWHGAYEVLRELAELQHMVEEKLHDVAGSE